MNCNNNSNCGSTINGTSGSVGCSSSDCNGTGNCILVNDNVNNSSFGIVVVTVMMVMIVTEMHLHVNNSSCTHRTIPMTIACRVMISLLP